MNEATELAIRGFYRERHPIVALTGERLSIPPFFHWLRDREGPAKLCIADSGVVAPDQRLLQVGGRERSQLHAATLDHCRWCQRHTPFPSHLKPVPPQLQH